MNHKNVPPNIYPYFCQILVFLDFLLSHFMEHLQLQNFSGTFFGSWYICVNYCICFRWYIQRKTAQCESCVCCQAYYGGSSGRYFWRSFERFQCLTLDSQNSMLIADSAIFCFNIYVYFAIQAAATHCTQIESKRNGHKKKTLGPKTYIKAEIVKFRRYDYRTEALAVWTESTDVI